MAENNAACVFWGTGGGDDCLGPSFVNFLMAGFFLFWNGICSQLILIPLMRFYYFGCGDKQARISLITLICPHWVIGLVMPYLLGGLLSALIAIGIPYTFCGYRIHKLCKAEMEKGQMISIKEEVDAFLNEQKIMRICSVRLSNDRLMFTATGKNYGHATKDRTLEFLLDPGQQNVSNDIVAMLAGTRTRAVLFTDKSGQNIKLVLTRLVGLVNQDSLEAEPLPRRANSLTQRVLNLSDPKYQFTAVATPYSPFASYSGFLPSQPVMAVATVVPPILKKEVMVWREYRRSCAAILDNSIPNK